MTTIVSTIFLRQAVAAGVCLRGKPDVPNAGEPAAGAGPAGPDGRLARDDSELRFSGHCDSGCGH
jgi:hypothetical protein